jgi:hypothetical protein
VVLIRMTRLKEQTLALKPMNAVCGTRRMPG